MLSVVSTKGKRRAHTYPCLDYTVSEAQCGAQLLPRGRQMRGVLEVAVLETPHVAENLIQVFFSSG